MQSTDEELQSNYLLSVVGTMNMVLADGGLSHELVMDKNLLLWSFNSEKARQWRLLRPFRKWTNRKKSREWTRVWGDHRVHVRHKLVGEHHFSFGTRVFFVGHEHNPLAKGHASMWSVMWSSLRIVWCLWSEFRINLMQAKRQTLPK